jgi:hypothetical protein
MQVIVSLTASGRLIWPSITFCHIGEFGLLEIGAMKTSAAEIRALMLIFGSSGR